MARTKMTPEEDSLRTQKIIHEKHGDQAIDDAVSKYCIKCDWHRGENGCHMKLMPLQINGESCLYYKGE